MSEGLANALRVLGAASAGSTDAELLDAAQAVLDAADNEDFDEYLPDLVERIAQLSSPVAMRELARAVAPPLLRAGDVAALARLADALRTHPEHFRGAIEHGLAKVEPSPSTYALAIRLLVGSPYPGAGNAAVAVLGSHLQDHPRRFDLALDAMEATAPHLVVRLLINVLRPSFRGDPQRAIPILLGVRDYLGRLARHALCTIGSDGEVDLGAVLPAIQGALSADGTARTAAFLLATHELAQAGRAQAGRAQAGRASLGASVGESWDALNALCRDPSQPVRWGASRAGARAWRANRYPRETSRLLALGLADSSAPVREEAYDALVQGVVRGQPLGDLPTETLDQLAMALASEAPSPIRPNPAWPAAPAEAIGSFLEDYLDENPERTHEVLDALTRTGSAHHGAGGELARSCRERLAGRHEPPCPSCRGLTRVWWGEQMAEIGFTNRPPPPRLEGMTRSADLYRCPACGTSFERREDGGAWLNAEWTYYFLVRRQPDRP